MLYQVPAENPRAIVTIESVPYIQVRQPAHSYSVVQYLSPREGLKLRYTPSGIPRLTYGGATNYGIGLSLPVPYILSGMYSSGSPLRQGWWVMYDILIITPVFAIIWNKNLVNLSALKMHQHCAPALLNLACLQI